MLKNKKTLYFAMGVFALAELALSLLLQWTGGRLGAYIRYAVVLLAAVGCLLFISRKREYFLTQAALILTLCADYFLVLSPVIRQLPAMFFFSAVQLCYAARLHVGEPAARRRLHLLVRGGASAFALILTASVLQARADALSLISLFYFANLSVNVIFAFLQWKRSPLFAIGLLLFACCDAVIGLSYVGAYLTLSPAAAFRRDLRFGFDLAWAFYAPAQALLALSPYSFVYEEKA